MQNLNLSIETFDQLLEHEKEIVEVINAIPIGGNLFMAHPFKLLEDLGVQLNEKLVREIKDREPFESGFSEAAYAAIQESPDSQTVRFHLSGLFRTEESERSRE